MSNSSPHDCSGATAPPSRFGGTPGRLLVGHQRSSRLGDRATFVLLSSTMVSLLAAASAPTPLYAIYARKFAFSSTTLTVIFGIYAVSVLTALLIGGSLSDHVGRRPILLAGITVEIVSMIVFATAASADHLLLARLLQGVATGTALAAVGAGLVDVDNVRGTVANGVGGPAGTAVGAIGSALVVSTLPAPTELVYLVLVGVFVLQAIGVLLMTETSPATPGALASLRPRFAIPAEVRGPLLIAAPVLFAVWSLAGYYASLGPILVRTIDGSSSVVVGALALTALAGTASLTVFLGRAVEPRRLMFVATPVLFAGAAVTLCAVSARSPVAFFIGSAISGIGFGGGLQASLGTVVPKALPQERAGVLSIVFVVSYLGLGIPAVLAGIRVVHAGIDTTASEYLIAVMTLAAVALAGVTFQRTV
jgi:MFS family permease